MGNWYKFTVNNYDRALVLNGELIGFTKDDKCAIVLVSGKRIYIPRYNIIQMKRMKLQGRQR